MQKENQLTRVFVVLENLFFDPINGLSNKELIEKTTYSPVDVCRLLKGLEEVGWAEKNDINRWTPTVKVVGLLKKYNLQVASISQKIETLEARSNAYARR